VVFPVVGALGRLEPVLADVRRALERGGEHVAAERRKARKVGFLDHGYI